MVKDTVVRPGPWTSGGRFPSPVTGICSGKAPLLPAAAGAFGCRCGALYDNGVTDMRHMVH